MSIERLKEVRDEVIATGHGLYLESTQKLLAAIEEHILQPVKSATKKVKEEAASAEVVTVAPRFWPERPASVFGVPAETLT